MSLFQTSAGGGGMSAHGNEYHAPDMALATDAMPAGVVAWFAADAPPAGFLECDGAAVSRSTYAALHSAIGTVFGAGDGSTTFNLPDLRGEFVRGWDNGRGVDSGRTFGAAQADAFKAHTHDVSATGGLLMDGTDRATVQSASLGTAVYDSAALETGDIETRPRNVALLACIKY